MKKGGKEGGREGGREWREKEIRLYIVDMILEPIPRKYTILIYLEQKTEKTKTETIAERWFSRTLYTKWSPLGLFRAKTVSRRKAGAGLFCQPIGCFFCVLKSNQSTAVDINSNIINQYYPKALAERTRLTDRLVLSAKNRVLNFNCPENVVWLIWRIDQVIDQVTDRFIDQFID